jgi:hypothetical protein
MLMKIPRPLSLPRPKVLRCKAAFRTFIQSGNDIPYRAI